MIYETIEKLCQQRGVKITNLCVEITNSPGNLIAWKKDSFKPAILKKIADYFGVTTDYLITGEESKKVQNSVEQLGDLQFALSGEVKDLTDEEAQDILNYIKFKKSQRK